ncbi:hypothetical protein ACJ51O_07880 [Burkholderia pyrrocinia]|uniref:hypothetical protein n=1 Tax=Burkholderia pyrrocinia TaxID=60550 RepID=UPI0038B5DD54
MPNDNVLTIDRIESLARAHLYVGDDEVVFGTENFARAIEREVLAAHPGQPEQKDAHGWLRSGGLLYRLTDERHPQNRDEINVTMADGSREISGREARAQQLLALLTGQPEPRAEVMDDWIKVDIQRPTEAGIEPDDDVIAWNNDPGFPTIVEASFVSPGFPEYTHWKKKPHGPIDAASAEGSARDER